MCCKVDAGPHKAPLLVGTCSVSHPSRQPARGALRGCRAVGQSLRLWVMPKARRRNAARWKPTPGFQSPVPKMPNAHPRAWQVPGGRAKAASHASPPRSPAGSWSQQQEGTKKMGSRDAAPVCLWGTWKNRKQEKHCQEGLTQAAASGQSPGAEGRGTHLWSTSAEQRPPAPCAVLQHPWETCHEHPRGRDGAWTLPQQRGAPTPTARGSAKASPGPPGRGWPWHGAPP